MIAQSLENRSALSDLQKRWWAFTLLCSLFLVAGGIWLTKVWLPVYALGWGVFTLAVLAYQAWLLRSSLHENRRIGETRLLSGLGWGNIITLTRGVLFAGLTGFLLLPPPPGWLAWIPAMLYTVGALIDYLDGYVARITNQVTHLGEKLDMSLDGWGLLVASILAVRYGQVPVWYLLVGAVRYLFLAGLWLRRRKGWQVAELLPSPTRRPFAGLQMGFAFVMLWPIFRPPGTFHAAAFFSLPFLINFFIDWLVVSQTLKPGFGIRWHNVTLFAVRWLPLGLRGAVLVLMIKPLAGWGLGFPGQLASFARFEAPLALVIGLLLAALEWTTVSLIALGAAGRIAAIAGMVALGIHQFFQPLTAMQIVLLWVYGGILYLGTGLFSAWKPEDRLIYRRAGEKSG